MPSDDKNNITIGSASVNVVCTDEKSNTKSWLIDYKTTGFHIKAEFRGVSSGFCIGSGNTLYGANKDDGVLTQRYYPHCEVFGSAFIDDNDAKEIKFEGLGIFLQMFQDMKPHLHSKSWNLVHFVSKKNDAVKHSENTSALMMQFESPIQYDGKKVNQACIVLNGRLYMVSIDNAVIAHHPVLDTVSRYKVPALWVYEWKGIAEDGTHIKGNITIAPKTLIERIDILEKLPYVLRKVIQAFVTRPFAYEWLDDAELEIQFGDSAEKVKLSGTLFHEYTILNE